MLAAPSRNEPMPSAAPLAALERRLADGGGVARGLLSWLVLGAAVDEAAWVVPVWGLAAASGFASLMMEAARYTDTTDDDDTEVLREEVRRCEWAGRAWSGWCSGGAAGLPCIFMLARAWGQQDGPVSQN
jgi:hypothetical protein